MSTTKPARASNQHASLLMVALVGVALVVLALDPVLWLVRSWYAPGYDSAGGAVFAWVLALFVWSVTSPVRPSRAHDAAAVQASHRLPAVLLLLSFVVRLASQLLAVNVLGALMLALDVYAIALFLRLSERARPVSPAMVAALFCFALPLESMLQRSLGFVLQQISAASACSLLSAMHSSAGCEGVRLFIDEMDVLVDLPCSGARVLVLLLTGFFTLAALHPRPDSQPNLQAVRELFAGLVLVVLVAWLANTLRILLLAWGLRYAEVIGVDVMHDPWHSGIGLAIAGLGISVMCWWFRRRELSRSVQFAAPPERSATEIRSANVLAGSTTATCWWQRRGLGVAFAGGLLALALVLVSLKPQPVDVSRPLVAPQLPLSLAGVARTSLPLSPLEQEYFQTYGGSAARAGYGNHSLLLVRTTSPLRHLHSPEVCFSASGHAVTYQGIDFSGAPTAVYRSVSPTGAVLRVRVQFVSASGFVAHSISEVVWRWLQDPAQSWTMVQTVSPWHDQSSDSEGFLVAVKRALNLVARV